MKDWLTHEEEERERRSAWKTKLGIGLAGAIVVLPMLTAIKGWLGL